MFEKLADSCCFGASSVDDILQRVLQVCRELAGDRGFSKRIVTPSLHEAIQDSQPVLLAQKENGCGLHVFFHIEDRIGVKFLRLLDETYGDDVSKRNRTVDVLVVSIDGPTPCTRKEAAETRPWVQMMTFKELFVNISRHELVPPHRLITQDERTGLQARLRLSDDFSELPRLFSTDAVAKYYRFRPGDIVRIDRPLGTVFRLVT